VFIVVTALSIFQIRPFALRYLHKADEERVSNADALLGQHGVVSETIKAGGYGRVAIGGDDWKAVSTEDSDIPVGTRVKVIGRESIIITVERL
jgi:membrane protein implicated in regulation of membrane protease activity